MKKSSWPPTFRPIKHQNSCHQMSAIVTTSLKYTKRTSSVSAWTLLVSVSASPLTTETLPPWPVQNLKLGAPMTADGGSSPMVKPKGDKQVEYLDLDLDPGKSTPPRKVRWPTL